MATSWFKVLFKIALYTLTFQKVFTVVSISFSTKILETDKETPIDVHIKMDLASPFEAIQFETQGPMGPPNAWWYDVLDEPKYHVDSKFKDIMPKELSIPTNGSIDFQMVLKPCDNLKYRVYVTGKDGTDLGNTEYTDGTFTVKEPEQTFMVNGKEMAENIALKTWEIYQLSCRSITTEATYNLHFNITSFEDVKNIPQLYTKAANYSALPSLCTYNSYAEYLVNFEHPGKYSWMCGDTVKEIEVNKNEEKQRAIVGGSGSKNDYIAVVISLVLFIFMCTCITFWVLSVYYLLGKRVVVFNFLSDKDTVQGTPENGDETENGNGDETEKKQDKSISIELQESGAANTDDSKTKQDNATTEESRQNPTKHDKGKENTMETIETKQDNKTGEDSTQSSTKHDKGNENDIETVDIVYGTSIKVVFVSFITLSIVIFPVGILVIYLHKNGKITIKSPKFRSSNEKRKPIKLQQKNDPEKDIERGPSEAPGEKFPLLDPGSSDGGAQNADGKKTNPDATDTTSQIGIKKDDQIGPAVADVHSASEQAPGTDTPGTKSESISDVYVKITDHKDTVQTAPINGDDHTCKAASEKEQDTGGENRGTNESNDPDKTIDDSEISSAQLTPPDNPQDNHASLNPKRRCTIS